LRTQQINHQERRCCPGLPADRLETPDWLRSLLERFAILASTSGTMRMDSKSSSLMTRPTLPESSKLLFSALETLFIVHDLGGRGRCEQGRRQ
jgi:hypothetical protein